MAGRSSSTPTRIRRFAGRFRRCSARRASSARCRAPSTPDGAAAGPLGRGQYRLGQPRTVAGGEGHGQVPSDDELRTIRTLSQVEGIALSDQPIEELVLPSYKNLLVNVRVLEAYPVPVEIESAHIFDLSPGRQPVVTHHLPGVHRSKHLANHMRRRTSDE